MNIANYLRLRGGGGGIINRSELPIIGLTPDYASAYQFYTTGYIDPLTGLNPFGLPAPGLTPTSVDILAPNSQIFSGHGPSPNQYPNSPIVPRNTDIFGIWGRPVQPSSNPQQATSITSSAKPLAIAGLVIAGIFLAVKLHAI